MISKRDELFKENGKTGETQLVGGWFTNPFEQNAQVKLDHETPRIGVKITKIFELPPPSKYIHSLTTKNLPLKTGGFQRLLSFWEGFFSGRAQMVKRKSFQLQAAGWLVVTHSLRWVKYSYIHPFGDCQISLHHQQLM